MDFVRVLRKFAWLITATIVVVLTAAGIYTARSVPLYEASARVAINPQDSDVLGLRDGKGIGTDGQDSDYTVSLETQVYVLRSDHLALLVIKNLYLDSNPGFAPVSPPAKPSIRGAPVALDHGVELALLNAFRAGLTVNPIRNTRLVEIRYRSRDPRLAADIVNSLVNSYIEENFRTKYEATTQASDFLGKQLKDLELKVETSQEKLVRYQRENNILGIDEKQNIITQKLDDLNKQLTEAQGDRIRKQSLYQTIASGNFDQAVSAIDSPAVQQQRTQLATLETQLAQLTTQFGPSHPKVAEAKNQIDQTKLNLTREIERTAARSKADYVSAVSREKMLASALEQQKVEANQLNERGIGFNLLKRDVEANRQLYEGLLQKMKEAGVIAGLKSGNVRVVDSARVPAKPVSPNVPRNMAIALLLGTISGMVVAFSVDRLENTVTTPEHVTAVTGLPVLGTIPLSEAAVRAMRGMRLRRFGARSVTSASRPETDLIVNSEPKSIIAESYRAFRTSILLSRAGTPPKVILVTSAVPQEGKTVTCINTAVVLAQKGARVLLVDCDLRRPRLHRAFGLTNGIGLSSVLANQQPLGDALQPAPNVPNLTVLVSGPLPPLPAELLGSERMFALMEQFRSEYDHIVIDSPPVLSVTDPVLLSMLADATVVVSRSAVTTRTALRQACAVLQQANARIIGIALNAVDLKSPDYEYYSPYYSPHSAYYS
jgi:capsular exopolysaccharide synthesis family protein